MREKGLGTPATRAQIIEGLIMEKYVHRDGRDLTPTAKAFSLMTLLHGLGVPELFSPELTAEWEFKLAQMEHGKLKRSQFMREIVQMTQHIVGQAKNYRERHYSRETSRRFAARCPKCGGEVHENYKKFQCQACDFGMWKIIAGRQLEIPEAEALAHAAAKSARSRAFAASSVDRSQPSSSSTTRYEAQFDFGDGSGDGADGEAPDFSGQESLGACPKCNSRVFELPAAYVCEKAVGPEKTCDFRSGRVILQRPIERAQMQKLLATGKTDLLQFVSSRTRRPFAAFLVRQPDGKIGFEFQAKGPGKGARRPRRGAVPPRCACSARIPRTSNRSNCTAAATAPTSSTAASTRRLPETDQVDSLTLAQALDLLAAKAKKGGGKTAKAAAKAAPKPVRRTRAA